MNTLGLAVTFMSGVAATVTVTARQIHPEEPLWLRWAMVALVASIVLALAVWALDLIREADPAGAVEAYKAALGVSGELDDESTLEAYLIAGSAAVALNDQQLVNARWVARAQITVSLLAVCLSTIVLWG